MTVIILFTRKGKSYRMRLPRLHLHPGDRDVFEVASMDMLDGISWSPVLSSLMPSGEWLVRRALWHLIEGGPRSGGPDLTIINLDELEI